LGYYYRQGKGGVAPSKGDELGAKGTEYVPERIPV